MASGWGRTRDAPLQGDTVEGDWSASEQQQPPEGPGGRFRMAHAFGAREKSPTQQKKNDENARQWLECQRFGAFDSFRLWGFN